MSKRRAVLEAEFMRMCRVRGPEWIESVIRPLRLPGAVIQPKDIPLAALSVIVGMFGGVPRATSGTAVV
jgi:hypothetical protein